MGILLVIGVILLFAFLITAFICASKVDKIIAPYVQYDVFGKMSAYISFDLTAVGIVAIVGGAILLFTGKQIENYVTYALATFTTGIILLFIGMAIYRNALKKCPDFLKSNCIRNMIAVGLGIAVKPALLLVKASMENAGGASGSEGYSRSYISRASGEEYQFEGNNGSQGVLRSISGQTVYVNRNSDGTVYDSNGTLYDPLD